MLKKKVEPKIAKKLKKIKLSNFYFDNVTLGQMVSCTLKATSNQILKINLAFIWQRFVAIVWQGYRQIFSIQC